MSVFSYRKVFDALERSLFKSGDAHLPVSTTQSRFEAFKSVAGQTPSDEDYFRILVQVTFYSGFREATFTSRLNALRRHFPSWESAASYNEEHIDTIASDPQMISHRGKIAGCVTNAKIIAKIIAEWGSIKSYIDGFAPETSFENLLLLKESLEGRFAYLGGVSVYHFMTDIGLPVLKPDRGICRIFTRLGLLENEQQLLKAVVQGRKFAEATGHPIRYIDIVLAAFGQVQSKEFGIQRGVCLGQPRCGNCEAKPYCQYGSSHALE